jgi:hypothetical protein
MLDPQHNILHVPAPTPPPQYGSGGNTSGNPISNNNQTYGDGNYQQQMSGEKAINNWKSRHHSNGATSTIVATSGDGALNGGGGSNAKQNLNKGNKRSSDQGVVVDGTSAAMEAYGKIWGNDGPVAQQQQHHQYQYTKGVSFTNNAQQQQAGNLGVYKVVQSPVLGKIHDWLVMSWRRSTSAPPTAKDILLSQCWSALSRRLA